MLVQHFMVMDQGSQMRVASCEEERSWDAVPPGGHDAALRWLEAFADKLKYQLGCSALHWHTKSRNPRVICLYPVKQPWEVSWANCCSAVWCLFLRLLAYAEITSNIDCIVLSM